MKTVSGPGVAATARSRVRTVCGSRGSASSTTLAVSVPESTAGGTAARTGSTDAASTRRLLPTGEAASSSTVPGIGPSPSPVDHLRQHGNRCGCEGEFPGRQTSLSCPLVGPAHSDHGIRLARPLPRCALEAGGVSGWRERSALMAHAAPAGGFARTPDVFDAKVHTAARYGIPVVLGLVYGYWAAAN